MYMAVPALFIAKPDSNRPGLASVSTYFELVLNALRELIDADAIAHLSSQSMSIQKMRWLGAW